MQKDKERIRYQLIEALSKSPLLQFIGHSAAVGPELREMVEHCEVVAFKQGRTIIGEGDEGDQMYFLASGKVEVRKGGAPVCVLDHSGDVFGELSAVTGELRSAAVVAQTDVTCLVTDAGFIDRLSREGKHFFLHILQQALTRVFTERLKVTTQQLVNAQESVEELKRDNATLRATNARLRKEAEGAQKGKNERIDWARRQEQQPKKDKG